MFRSFRLPRAISLVEGLASRPHQRSIYGYTQAKALAFEDAGSPDKVLRLQSHSISPPHSNLVTVKTLSAPINPADINQIEGVYPVSLPATTSLSTASPCHVPGNEGCFEVLAIGSDVKSVQKGDWVIPRDSGLGTWRTHFQVDESKLWKVKNSKNLTKRQVGTAAVNPVTAWQLLRQFSSLQEGDWYVQNGANSAVGRMVIQLGKIWGFRCIALIRARSKDHGKMGTEELKQELKGLGADIVATYDEVADLSFKRDRLHQLERIKLGLNCVGGREGMQTAKLLSQGATLVTYGGMAKASMRIGAGSFIFSDLSLRGFWLTRWAQNNVNEKEQIIEKILDLMRSGDLRESPTQNVVWTSRSTLEDLMKPFSARDAGLPAGVSKSVYDFDVE